MSPLHVTGCLRARRSRETASTYDSDSRTCPWSRYLQGASRAHVNPVKIDVWSDIACPWCWLGKHHLEEALQRTGTAADVVFHSYELQPDLRGTRPVHEYLVDKYGGDRSSVDAAHERLAGMGRRVGITYDFEHAVMSNTFDAHRLHHFAMTRGLGGPVLERLMRARQGEGADLSDPATLRRLGVEAGLEAAAVEEVLAGDRFAKEVRADGALAVQRGVRGVPYFLIDGRLALSGAQPVEQFEAALREALSS